MAQGAEKPSVACREFPGRAHHSKLKSHEQKHHEQKCISSVRVARATRVQRGFKGGIIAAIMLPWKVKATLKAVVLLALAWGSPALCGPIHDAAKSGDLAKVRALLQENPGLIASNDENGLTPLYLAATFGHKDVAELLLAKGANANAKKEGGVTPLMIATEKGYKDVVELLLANGADVNADTRGNTALIMATQEGRRDLVQLLLAHKADVKGREEGGVALFVTPLIMAAQKDYKDLVELFLANGADVNAKTKDLGMTALHMVAELGHSDVAQVLLAHNADADARNQQGATPLHFAAFNGRRDVAELLLDHKADVNAKFQRFTPLDLAVQQSHADVAQLLRQHAQVPPQTTSDTSSAAVPVFVPMPQDIQCSVQGMSFMMAAGKNGELPNIDGSVRGVTCWLPGKTPEQKKDVPLVSTKITDGMLPTKDFGDLKLTTPRNLNSPAIGIAIQSDKLQLLREFLQK